MRFALDGIRWLSPARSLQQEMLDAPAVPLRELEENLADLGRLNGLLGSRRMLLTTLRRLWQRAGSPASWWVLDIGTGAGDMPAAWARWSQRQGFHACVVAIDQQWHVARYARLALGAAIPVCQADGLRLPFQPRSFDVVMCSHVLHHCDWQDAVALLRAMATVARYGVVVHDLVRSWLPYYGARLMLPWLSGNRLTRHDGPLSVLRAYRVPEMRQMARAAGLTEARIRTVWLHRLVLEYIHP